MNFKVGDRVVYTFQARSKIYTYFGVVKTYRKKLSYNNKSINTIQIFFPKEDIYMWISEDFLTLQPRMSKEDLL